MRTTEKTGRESVCDVASRCDPRVLFADGERLGGGSEWHAIEIIDCILDH